MFLVLIPLGLVSRCHIIVCKISHELVGRYDHNVILEIFVRVLFSRNFADAEFRENKTSQNGEITLSFTEVGKPCASKEF